MRSSRSRTGNTPPAELAGCRSQPGVGLGSPRPSASAGLAGSSRTLIAFSSSASSQGGGSSSVYRRVSSHAGNQRLDPMGSASAMHRSVIGQGGILSGTEHSHLKMQSSRSDSLIHDIAQSGKSRSASQRTSGNALNGLTSIHITPVSSGIESMFDSRTSRDHGIRGKTRSGEGTASVLAQQPEESGSSISSRRMRRLSGSQIRQSRSAATSASRSPSNREERGTLRELVELEMHGGSPRYTTLSSPLTAASKVGSHHSSRGMRHGAQRQTSSSLAANAKSSRSGALQGARSTSSGHVRQHGAASSSEKMVRSTKSSKGALQSASKTEYESARRQQSETDKRRMSASKLAAVPLTESATRKGLASVPGLFSIDATFSTSDASRIGQGLEMSTTLTAARTTGAAATKESNVSAFTSREKVNAVGSTTESKGLVSSSTSETTNQVSATGETAPQGATLVDIRTATQSASVAGQRGLQQNILADDKNVTSGATLIQRSVSSKSQVQESKSLTQDSMQSSKGLLDSAPGIQAVAGIERKTSASAEQLSVRQTVLEKPGDTLAESPDNKPTLLTPGLPEKKSSSKSLIQKSEHQASLPSDRAHSISTLGEDIFTTPTSKGTSSKSVIQESVYQRIISSDRVPDTLIQQSDAGSKTVTAAAEEQSTFQKTITDKQAVRTLDTDVKAGLAEKPEVAIVDSSDKTLLANRTSSKSLTQESVRRASLPSEKMALNATLTDTSGKTSTSTKQETVQHKFLDNTTTFTLADSAMKSGLLARAGRKRTSSRSLIQESVHRALSSSMKAPDVLIVSDVKSTTLTNFKHQGAVQQIVSDKGTAHTVLDVPEKTTVMPPSSLKKRTSSKSLIHRTSFQLDKQPDAPRVTGSKDELLICTTKVDVPQHRVLGTETGLTVSSCERSSVSASFAPEKTSTKSVSKESVSRTISSTAGTAGSKEILSAAANEDVIQRKVVGKESPTSTDANNYSLSTGAQLTMTQKCSTRWKNDAPIQQSFFEKIEGSNYQKTFDSALQRSQVPSSGVKEDFQSFQVTISTEPSLAAIQSPLKPEPLATKSPLDLRKEEKVESATGLTPMPDFPLLGSTPKASSEEVRHTETVHKVTDRSDTFQWPRLDTSSRLGAAAALFDTPLHVTHFDQRPIQAGLSQSTERIEQVTRVEKQAGAEFPRKRVFGPQTLEEFQRTQVAEPLIKPETAHLLYEGEQEREVGVHAGHQMYTDSSLIQYTPQDSILAEIVREVERKIEASARYHVEPLPDDVLVVRSSKGIESLGMLKYETYEEELLMRRSEDDLTQEPQKTMTEVAEEALVGAEQAKIVTDQDAYSGALEEFYSAAAQKKVTEKKSAELIQTDAQRTEVTTKEAEVKTEELVSGVAEQAQEESRVTERELEQRAELQEGETEAKKLAPEQTFDMLREQRKRLSEQRGEEVSAVSEAQMEEKKAGVQERATLETTPKVGLTAAQGETEGREAKVYVKKHETRETPENAVRRFIAAAIEEAAKREEASKSVKRFREYPCSAEESPRKVQPESSESSAMESSADQERRCEELKIHKDKSLPQLVRCKSIAELIEQIIQQHVSGTDVRKHAIALDRQAAHTADMARPPELHTNIVQQEIPVYYQTATTSRRFGDQYVNDYRSSLLGVQRKSDGNTDQSQLESASQGERRMSFSSRGARCVIRKLEPGALTYLVEVAPSDKSQENQTDMVMAEEQVLVSEIFDHITAPSLRVSSSGSKMNEPITVSPAASLTAIRNAYAEAVARRVLSGRSASDAEGVLGAAQKAQFFDDKQWSKDGKTASSTSLPSAASVEDYMLQTMLASGVLKNKAEPWIKRTSKFESEVSTRSPSMEKLSKTAASHEGIVAPPSTPLCNAEPTAEAEGGTGSTEDATQDLAPQAPKDDAPPNVLFASVTAEGAAASAFSEARKPTVEAAGSTEQVSSAAVSGSETEQKSETTTSCTTVGKSETQNAVARQPSAGSLKGVVRSGSCTCALCNDQIHAEEAFQSFICFGRHDLPKYWADVPSVVSENIKLRIATDDDVRQLLSLPFKDADSACVVPAAVVTRHILCPNGFFVAVDASQGSICGAASVIIFDEEVAFCGFCHIFEDCPFQEIGALLWNQMLHVTSGKNLFTLLPEPASQELQNIYQFPFNPATGILFGTARLSRSAFARTILVLEYKDKYFDALASYDKHVFGFSRKRYLASTVHEVGLDIRVATRNERNICGYGGVQRDEVGRRILRWLFADDAETAESLLSSLLCSCSDENEVDLIAAFFLRSTATRPILDKIGSRELKPWRLLYTKREPVHSYGRIVCLTTA